MLSYWYKRTRVRYTVYSIIIKKKKKITFLYEKKKKKPVKYSLKLINVFIISGEIERDAYVWPRVALN